MALGASILALAGMTAWLAPSASAASPAASAKATLKIVVSDLPARAAAAVKVTGPDGYSRKVTATISLTGLAAGTYDVTATAVTVSGTNYVPAVTGASQDLKAGGSATSTVAYYTQIPATTKPVSASAITSVTTSSSGTMTIVVHGASPLAKGDVLAVGTGKATPDGLLAKITKTSASGSAQTLTATAATLKEAIPQGEFDYSEALGSEAAGTSSSGVLSGSLRASSAGGFSDNFECGSDASLDVKGTATADDSATLDGWPPLSTEGSPRTRRDAVTFPPRRGPPCCGPSCAGAGPNRCALTARLRQPPVSRAAARSVYPFRKAVASLSQPGPADPGTGGRPGTGRPPAGGLGGHCSDEPDEGEPQFTGWMAPRGIVAAAAASIFSAQLVAILGPACRAEHQRCVEDPAATFLVVVATVAMWACREA
jgi:hypothetical protein